jgi:[pyruvate, water dikinase]-phosphate phosphotransferase / [pyruvate, water dikinase] kinase
MDLFTLTKPISPRKLGCMNQLERRIIIVSDATGETASQMITAALVQFGEQPVSIARYKNVRAESQIQSIVDDAHVHRDLLIFTIVSPHLRAFLQECSREKGVPYVDILGPLLLGIANFLGLEPKMTAGLLHGINERYFQRIEAMEYTIAHDDGRDLQGLNDADLVIMGISRTSKTPLSMYLSHQGWKVANIPMIKGFEIPKEIFEIDQRKIVGLTIDPDELITIRRARLQRLGHERGGEYADPEKVQSEVDYAATIFRKNRRWPVFNVTGKALEETASEIIKLMSTRNLVPQKSLDFVTGDDSDKQSGAQPEKQKVTKGRDKE